MRKVSFILLLVMLISACNKETVILLSPNTNPYIVIDGMFTDSLKKHQFIFTLTSNLGTNNAVKASPENVQVQTPTDTVFYLNLGNGIYESEIAFQGIYGENYTLSFDYQGKNHEVMTQMPFPINYSQFDFYPNYNTSATTDSLGFSIPKSTPTIYFDAESPTEQYVRFKFYIAEQAYMPLDTIWNEIPLPIHRLIHLNAGLTENIHLPFEVSDQVYPLNTDLVKIEFYAISKDFATYLLKLKDFEKGVASEDQFYNPPFFFSNEAYGIGYGTVIDSLIYQYPE